MDCVLLRHVSPRHCAPSSPVSRPELWRPCSSAMSQVPPRAPYCSARARTPPEELDDLLFVQDELTDNVLDRYDRLHPGHLEARAARLQQKLHRIRRIS